MPCHSIISGRRTHAALLCGVALFAGCSCRPEATQGMVLKVGNGAEVQELDPHQVSGVSEHRVLNSLFEGLANADPATLEPVPGAASSWVISADGLHYVFHLRPEGKWSNGDQVTAGDFVYAWRRALAPKLAAEYAYMLHCLRGAKAFNEGATTDPGTIGVHARDDLTLEVDLEHPTPCFLRMQIHNVWYPVHQSAIEQYGAMDERGVPWTRPGRHVGNGAFQLVDWQPNDVLRVRRNPHYWNAAKVRLDGIDFYPIDNQQTEERVFRAGLLDMTYTMPLHKIPIYQEKHPELIQIHPYLGSYFYRINVTKPPFNDVRVRRALAMALNREEITAHVMKGGELPADHLVPPGLKGYTATASLPYDPEQAKRLLAEAGYPDGQGMLPVEILFNTAEVHRTIAETVQRMWRETLHVDARLLNQDWKVFLTAQDTLDYTVSRSSWIADVPDPVNFLECFLTGVGNNRTGWSSTEYDRLIQASYAEADPGRRESLLQQAESLLMQEAPIIPIYFYTWFFLKSPRVQGFVPNPLGYIRWTDLWLGAAGEARP